MLMISLLLLTIGVSLSQAQTQCHTTSWWAFLPFDRSVLQPFLASIKDDLSFNLSNPLMKYMNPDQHPVYLEFNQQNHCEQSSLPSWLANATEQTFVEFKLEIPYLIRKGKPVLIKPLIYQNSHLDVTASHLVYGLPASYATMHADFNQNSYTISTSKGTLQVSFEPLSSSMFSFGSIETKNFSSFIDANLSPWLAFPPFALSTRTKCASNIYDFPNTGHLRPVRLTMEVIGDLLGSIPAGVYQNPGDHPLGAWQIDVHTTITSAYECP